MTGKVHTVLNALQGWDYGSVPGNILYLSLDSGYKGVYIGKVLELSTLKIFAFYNTYISIRIIRK